MLRRRMVKGQQELEQKVMFQMPVAFWWKLVISLTPTSRKPTTPANSDWEQWVFSISIETSFSHSQVHVSIKVSTEKKINNTVNALTTVEEEQTVWQLGEHCSTDNTKRFSQCSHRQLHTQTLPAHSTSGTWHMGLVKQHVCGCH